jgi:DNA invertase Pin-like site-specific DNA recombinase
MQRGYARVSTAEQDTGLQRDALARAGVDQVYEEKRSGADSGRPELARLLDELQPGDVLVVYKLDRLARSLSDLLLILERIGKAGAAFRSLTETLDTTSASGRMVMQVLGAFAEFERSLIVERTVSGMAAARKRGARFGRPRAMSPQEEAAAVELVRSREWSLTEAANRYGCHVSSIKRALSRATGAPAGANG